MSDCARSPAEVVDQLLSVGLMLENARELAGPGLANDRITAAADRIEALIMDLRLQLFDRPLDHAAAIRHRMIRTARALQTTALQAAAVIEQQANAIERLNRSAGTARLQRVLLAHRCLEVAASAARIAHRWENLQS